MCGVRGLAVLFVLFAAACGVDGTGVALRPAVPEPPPRGAGPPPSGVECVIDGDCELVPVITCCEECAPVPPFESVPRSSIDTLLLETEERCLRDTRACSAWQRCEPPPQGCVATARCHQGRCSFVATGCTRPNV